MSQPAGSTARLTLTRRSILAAVLIMLLAFALRVVVVFDRAQADPRFIPLAGSDQYTYVTSAELFLQGHWPDAPYFLQPGVTYFDYIPLRAVLGPSIGLLALGTSVLDALACGFMVGVGWLLTRRMWGGYLAGLLLAVYPVAIFYAGSLLIAPFAMLLLTLFVFLTLWQREELRLWRTVLIGLIAGIVAVTRMNLIPVLLCWPLFLALSGAGRRTVLAHGGLMLVLMAAVIAPFTLWNSYAGNGQSQLIASTGSRELYIGNNRDASGVYDGYAPAMHTADSGYISAIFQDIRLEPVRWVELLGRKFAIFWGVGEPGNNLDYVENGRALSPLLQAIPLDFLMLSVAGLSGLAALYFHDRRLALYLGAMVLMMVAGLVLSFVNSRLRYPVVALLVPLAAYCLVRLVEAIRGGTLLSNPRRYVLPAVLVAAVTLFPVWALSGNPVNLPAKRVYSVLPDDAIRLDAVFGDSLRLVGWRPVPSIWPAPVQGWVVPGQSYVVELFWDVLQPVSEDYNYYLAYVDDGTRYGGIDRPVGAVSFPPKPTSRWKPGEIYGEISGFRVDGDAPLAHSGQVMVGVYVLGGSPEDAYRPITNIPVTAPAQDLAITLQTFASYNGIPAVPENIPGTVWPFGSADGDQIILRGFDIPERVQAGETATFTFYWEAPRDVTLDYNLFVHVMGAGDQPAAQYDGAPGGELLTSNWMPGYPVVTSIPLQMPQQPGTYEIYIGLYDTPAARFRLAADAPDNRPMIARIVVE